MESSKEDQDDNDGHGQTQQQQKYKHHPSLTVLDLGFNNIGNEGCTSLATLAVARNPALSTLYISGNAVREAGALALAEVIAGEQDSPRCTSLQTASVPKASRG